MKCKYCNSEMRLDDVDYNFKGNKDNYWLCDNCNASAFEKIRYTIFYERRINSMIPPILPFMIIHRNQRRNFEMQQRRNFEMQQRIIQENKNRKEKKENAKK